MKIKTYTLEGILQRNGSVSFISYSSFVFVNVLLLFEVFVLDLFRFVLSSGWKKVKNDSLNVKQANADLDEFTVRKVN